MPALVHNQCADNLADNLNATNRPRPSNVDVPHHIVPRGSYRGNLDVQRAKDVLTRNGIDLDDADNGVWLPSSRQGATTGTIHERIHTNRYFQEVADRLERAELTGIAGAVETEMANIASLLDTGLFPF